MQIDINSIFQMYLLIWDYRSVFIALIAPNESLVLCIYVLKSDLWEFTCDWSLINKDFEKLICSDLTGHIAALNSTYFRELLSVLSREMRTYFSLSVIFYVKVYQNTRALITRYCMRFWVVENHLKSNLDISPV